MGRIRGKIFLIAVVVLSLIIAGCILNFVMTPPYITMTVGSTDAARSPGETVTVHVEVAGNPGFTGMTAYVDHDRERLELVGVEQTYSIGGGQRAEYLPDAQTRFDIVMSEGVDTGLVQIEADRPIEEKETMIFGLTFNILPEAEIGVADISLFGVEFTCAEGDTVETVEAVTVDGGILVGESLCDHEDADKDVICDLCGAQAISVRKIDVSAARLSYQHGVELQFLFNNRLPRSREYVAVMTHSTPSGEIRTEKPSTIWGMHGSNFHVVSYAVEAKEMCDEISFAIYDSEGYLYTNDFRVSVRDILTERLEDPERSDEEKRIYVDTLNFGAEAQLLTNYKTDDLANSRLTEEQRALASQPVVCEDISERGPNYLGASFDIHDRMTLSTYFSGFSGKDVADMYAKISYLSTSGTEQWSTVSGVDFVPYGEGSYKIVLGSLSVADAASPVSVTVYNKDGTVHGSCVESAYSCIARRPSDSNDTLFQSFAKLTESLRAYALSE